VARECAQTSVHGSELDVERVDHRQRDGDLLAGCAGPIQPSRFDDGRVQLVLVRVVVKVWVGQ
jgi:hypothetical protein